MTEQLVGRVSVNSKAIETVYREYLADTYQVNRRYQRKLVWSVDEKEALIDSILRQYPLPQFLVAEDLTSGSPVYEIIDGMQRMNAIVAFLENEYSLGGRYFDLAATADTKARLDMGELTQRSPVLSREDSVAIATYNIAQSVYQTTDPKRIEDVFRRINSSGQKLSQQDLRQAGTISPVADVVREISTRIRGDVSRASIVPLSLMSKLSISTTAGMSGISPDSTVWVQHGILNRAGLRSSADEQLILDILINMLVNPYPKTGTPARNAMFGFEGVGGTSGSGESAVQAIAGARDNPAWKGSLADESVRDFFAVWERLERILDALPDGVRLVRHIGLSGNNPIPRYFEAIFTAMYEHVVKEASELTDVGAAIEFLSDIQSIMQMPGGGGEWGAGDKRATIESVRTRLAPAFNGPRADRPVGVPAEWGYSPTTVRDILNIAITERSAFECKQGVLRLGGAIEMDDAMPSKIMRTLTAISNTHPTVGGHVVLGIADRTEHLERVQELFPGAQTSEYRGFHIVGIEREADRLGLDLGSYWNDRLLRALQAVAGVAERYRSQVIRGAALARFQGSILGVFRAPVSPEPVAWEGGYWWREGSNNRLLEGKGLTRFLLDFRSRAES